MRAWPCETFRRRRLLFFALCGATITAALTALAVILSADGLTIIELIMLALFALNLPWLVIGFWNAVIGFVLSVAKRPLGTIVPLAGIDQPTRPVRGRIAIVMPVYEEDPDSVFRHLRTTINSLDARGSVLDFEVFVLSDTRDDKVAGREQALFDAWRAEERRPERLHYRRRLRNAGFKAGNIRDFCRRWGHAFDFMVVLDADSLMTGEALARMIHLMAANPRLGILQSLVVGLPAESPFARIFQFGMRHGMRSHTLGSTWWQGNAGPYWGHNAIIRLRPFIDHCRLPRLAGRPPFRGHVLSHDQVEAVLMRRAGYDVCVLPVEGGSYEANPPTLFDFMKRDLRWCQGNMQYFALLNLAGDNQLGRVQLILAILMYTAAPAWIGFCLLGLVQLLLTRFGMPVGLVADGPLTAAAGHLPGLGLALLSTVILMSLAPKLLGLCLVLLESEGRRRFGGSTRILGGAFIETLFSILMAPVLSLSQAAFIISLALGRPARWASQIRRGRTVALRDALRKFWPHTVVGALIALAIATMAPGVLPWTSPMLAGLLLAVPFTMITANPALGRRLAVWRVCATPEEFAPSREVRAVCAGLPHVLDPASIGVDRRTQGRGASPDPQAAA